MLSKKRIFWYFIVPVWLFLLFKLIMPFLLYNNLHIQDMIGHYFSAWYTKEYLWPNIFGWNPFHHFGFSRTQFYPPLYNILTMLLGFVLPLKLSFKLVLSLAVLATPISFYYLCRKIGFDQLKAGVCMLGMTSILFFMEREVGGNFFATFNAGLVSNALALPLAFFYLGKLQDLFKERKMVLPSVLMAVVVLSHFFTAIVVSVISFIFFMCNLKRRNLAIYLKHVFLTFLLCSFWLLPVIAKINYAASSYSPPSFRLSYLFYLIIFLLVIVSFSRTGNIRWALYSLLFLLAFGILGLFFPLVFHFYRIELFMVLLMVLLVVNFARKKASLVLLSIIFVMLITFNTSNLKPEGVKNVDIKDFGEVSGRVMFVGPAEFDIGYHTALYLIPLKTGNYGVLGFSFDSTLEESHLEGLFKDLLKNQFDNAGSDNLYYKGNKTKIIKEQLRLFNINYMISKNLTFPGSRKIMDNIFYNDYNLYEVSNSSVVEVLTYRPKKIDLNFENIEKWLYSENVSMIFVEEKVPLSVGNGNETAQIIDYSPKKVSFYINSTSPVPVFMKISYFPNWRAYINGKETKIYKVSPYFMLVYGKGLIELKYEKILVDWIGLILTIMGLIFVFVEVVK